ncbi:phosphoenolpyruvate--protein phosphotransferase [Engelhardtia mirabilis]|uniref:Phosphoenolpyruvate-protein phosphotransferase n=1 Tax=Engelhardtia mirabilis TaxID=2528011 RepID=A0A518BGA5_9BACT|nr:Phosphoenolpyruvate-protein phosphotransferase [Planctomycetes bacterium Pla133]QDV00344.1 Phosphoenolpyruvate-protein phosphotransferase [Planctomycetes bacterium Pla86]
MPTSRSIKGVAVSMGLAEGPVHIVRAGKTEVPTWSVREDDLPQEFARLAAALSSAAEELTDRQRAIARQASEKDAEIFAVHRMILQDPSALQTIERLIQEERINAEAAVSKLIERVVGRVNSMEGASVRDYANDLADPWRRVLEHLLQRDQESIAQSEAKVILAAAELTPKVVTFLPRERILGVVTEQGGRFSHAAVLARSLGIPCVVTLPNLLARLEQNMHVTVDGDHGLVQLRPGEQDLNRFRRIAAKRGERRLSMLAYAPEPAVSLDGARLRCEVNIESMRDFETFDVAHTDGVGLLRTEFLYMERSSFPSEEEQYRMYRRVVETMAGRTVTIRTLDVGGDKPLPYFKVPPEPNPALGWRGLRIQLQWPDLFQAQVRAMLRAASEGNLRILLPMVGSLEQVRQARRVIQEVGENLREQGYDVPESVPLGIMIEVPSLLFVLPQVMAEVDFVSVGTNDLVQYLLAVDRDNSWVARLYQPTDPAVMRALEQVATAAKAAGVPCSVCGDVASDPVAAVLLLGLGYDSVSVAPHFVPAIKFAVRRCTVEGARRFVRELLECSTTEGVKQALGRMREQLFEGVDQA